MDTRDDLYELILSVNGVADADIKALQGIDFSYG